MTSLQNSKFNFLKSVTEFVNGNDNSVKKRTIIFKSNTDDNNDNNDDDNSNNNI